MDNPKETSDWIFEEATPKGKRWSAMYNGKPVDISIDFSLPYKDDNSKDIHVDVIRLFIYHDIHKTNFKGIGEIEDVIGQYGEVFLIQPDGKEINQRSDPTIVEKVNRIVDEYEPLINSFSRLYRAFSGNK